MTRLTSNGRIERADEAKAWQRTCGVCDELITDDDVHTNDNDGEDCHGDCCPKCHPENPDACMICGVAEADLNVALMMLVELLGFDLDQLAPEELAALNRLQAAVG